MILRLTRENNPIWKQKFQNIKKITPEIKKLVTDMKDTLDLAGGVGLAAPQVGKPLRLFIVRFGKLNEVFINPKLISRGKETDLQEEGCLSVPRTWGQVSRVTKLEIDYLDLNGKRKKRSFAGYHARIIQHEYDHLSSIFFTNRITNNNLIYTYPPIKIVFFGTPNISLPTLYSLIGKQFVGEYEILYVVTAPDKPSGRGKKLSPTPVKQLAEKFSIPVLAPEKIRGNYEFISKLKEADPDFLVLISYGKILPKEVLEIPKKAPLNIHFSLLPKYKGPSPIQSAILNGDKITGVTIFKMNEKVDEGDVFIKAKVKINDDDTAESLSQRLSYIGADLINFAIHTITTGRLKAKKQNHLKSTYTKLISKDDGFIDLSNPPEKTRLERMVRAYHPWPGVWTKFRIKNNELRIKLLPGRKVQIEGRRPIPLKEFKKGYRGFNIDW